MRTWTVEIWIGIFNETSMQMKREMATLVRSWSVTNVCRPPFRVKQNGVLRERECYLAEGRQRKVRDKRRMSSWELRPIVRRRLPCDACDVWQDSSSSAWTNWPPTAAATETTNNWPFREDFSPKQKTNFRHQKVECWPVSLWRNEANNGTGRWSSLVQLKRRRGAEVNALLQLSTSSEVLLLYRTV